MRHAGAGPFRKGHWSVEEDIRLIQFVRKYGEGRWSKLAKAAGLQRCGKSCRLRWVNYLRPDIKRGHISEEEERLIIKLHSVLGNRWSLIAIHLPGRSDNEIKNYWRSHIKKKLKGMDLSNLAEGGHLDVFSPGCNLNGTDQQSYVSCDMGMIDGPSCNILDIAETTHEMSLAGHHDAATALEDAGFNLNDCVSNFNNGLTINDEENALQLNNYSIPNSNYLMQTSRDGLSGQLYTANAMQISKGDFYSGYSCSNLSAPRCDVEDKTEMMSGAIGEWESCGTKQVVTRSANQQQALSLPDSDLSWDVETLQTIVEVQNSTPSLTTEGSFNFELWDHELFAESDPVYLQHKFHSQNCY